MEKAMDWMSDQPERLNNGRLYWALVMVAYGLGAMA